LQSQPRFLHGDPTAWCESENNLIPAVWLIFTDDEMSHLQKVCHELKHKTKGNYFVKAWQYPLKNTSGILQYRP